MNCLSWSGKRRRNPLRRSAARGGAEGNNVSEDLPAIPLDHLKGAARTLFTMLVNELVNARLRPSDAILIEGRAVQLARIRRVRKQARANPNAAPIANNIEAECWGLARAFVKDCKHSAHTLLTRFIPHFGMLGARPT
jgi:hypothetical protein